MRVSFSDRELLGVWDYMLGAGHGGAELLAQVETWETLGLGLRFAPVEDEMRKLPAGTGFDVTKLSDEPQAYDMSPEAITYLRGVLGRAPQRIAMALLSAKALRRLG